MTSTQATFAGDVSAAALSPDGRTVAYATGEEGDVRLFVRDLTGGPSLEIWKGALAARLGWLPNGSQLIVASLADARSLPALWLVSRFGGTPRLVTTPGAYFAFSPDGSQLAHTLPGVAGFSVRTLDGTRTRRSAAGLPVLRVGMEPPANRIALLTIDDKDRYTVWSVTPEGNDVRRLSDSAAISAMCSSPSADVLYVFRERQGGKQLVKVPLAGTPEPAGAVLTSGLQMVSFQDFPICSISGDGQRLLYVRETGHANLWRLDLGGPKSTATALTRGTSNLGLPRVSPDGRWIVASETRGSSRRIVRLPLTGGEVAELTAGSGASYSPDGTRLAFVRGAQHVWVSDADGRAAQQVKDAQAGPNDYVTWFPDGRLAWQTSDVRNYRIRDLASGQDELLVKNPEAGWLFEPTFSPQRDQVAVFWNRIDEPQQRRGLWLLSWPSREERFIAPNLVPVEWTADSRWIYAFEPSMSTIVKVSPQTAKIEPVGSFPRGRLDPESCRLTPDRKAIVCSLYESVADAWIVDHFDPDVHGDRR